MLFGLSVPQEFVCLSQEQLDHPLSFHLTTRGSNVSTDITKTHLFLGYKPVIIGIPVQPGSDHQDMLNQDQFCISAATADLKIDTQWNGFPTSARAIAKLMLQKVTTLSLGSASVILLKATKGVHSFISNIHQRMNDVKRKIKPPKNNAITLEGNLADQVRIAYAIPRIVSVITVQNGKGQMNMFPTDLHGAISKHHYLSSLRIGGKASQQVDEVKKIVLSDVDAKCYNEVYALGKNHMKEMTSASEFDIEQESVILKTPLPAYSIGYRELKVKSAVDIGIHRLYLYDVLDTVALNSSSRLSHIHQYAAQWRADQGLQTPLMFRS